LPQTVSDKCAAEELGRIFVFIAAFPAMYLSEIGGKLGLLVSARGNIGMRCDNLTPRF
jgi:hypothetical protein